MKGEILLLEVLVFFPHRGEAMKNRQFTSLKRIFET